VDDHRTSPRERDLHRIYNPPRIKRRSKPVRRKRVLNDTEVRAFWQATADGSGYSALLRFLLLTGARRAKAPGLQHGDIVGKILTIRSEPREKPNAERLVLPQAVLDIVASQRRIEGNPHVFVGAGGADIRNFKRLKARLDAAMRQRIPDMPRWTVHDLRRTCRTKLSQLGVSEEIGERVLGHVLPGIIGIYNQHRYEAEMADALQKLADHIALLVDPPDNVVRLGGRAEWLGRP
jgi:integrase